MCSYKINSILSYRIKFDIIMFKYTVNCEMSPISFIFLIKCSSVLKKIEMQSYCLFHLFQALKYIDTFSNKNMYHHQVYQFICQLLQQLFQALKSLENILCSCIYQCTLDLTLLYIYWNRNRTMGINTREYISSLKTNVH